ncbi:ABC transporter substrate-binding protein [Cohnella sp. CIP 111063]|uniref:ABC transporter substrate-binding protein n=1 Tax=unclassified Cohnella TaxID=2636738 RepID=UPI000B8C583F|nr:MULTISPECIES: sugar ABC transporter substrate-binding protein [unclassified Cohnella]OXS52882.1 ABC transporter substrate-binding protein [Cohnella sp. CIP 111063]PRX59857.1 multiple sugar transport system substrate-binding protein [Cohnella sp. SGD-V74]
MTVKKRAKALTGTVAGVMLFSVLAGCGGNSGSKAEPSGSSGASGNAAEKQVKLRMIESLTSPDRTTYLKEMLARFELQNPNIKVELISPPFDQADNKIKTMLAAKQDLDVLEVRDLTVAEFVNNGYIEPLGEYVASWSEYNTITDVSKSVGSLDDKLYFVPNGMYQRQLFYRADWFKDAGLTPPTNYEELVESAIKLTDPNKNRYGFSFRGGSGANAVPDAIIQNYNFDNIDHEDPNFLNDGKTMFSTPEAKQALELYVKLFKEGSPKDSINWGFSEQVQAFTSGVTAMLLQDPDTIPSLKEKMDISTVGTAPMPKGPSGKSFVFAGGAGWGVTSYSPNKDAAFKLIQFLSGAEENTAFAKATGLVPIHTSASEDPFFQDAMYKSLLEMGGKPDEYVNLKANTKYPGTGKWGQVAMETGQAMLLGSASIDDTLKKWDEYWAKERENYNAK